MSGSGSGIASVKTQSKVTGERGKEVQGFFSPPPRRQMTAGWESSVPEWKLGCLVTEYGLPPVIRGSLHFGGCF